MKRIYNINGGIGRVISFTGVLENIKKKFPEDEIDIISNHPDVFYNNPNIENVYPINMPYLWDKIKDSYYFEPEPYNDYEFYHNKKHVINVFNILTTNEDIFSMPNIYLTEAELAQAKSFVEKMKTENGKEIVLFQPHGQAGGMGFDDPTYRSLTYEYAEKLAHAIAKKGYEVMIIKLPEQTGIKGYKAFNGLNGRQITALLPYVKYCIGIDSFLQHAAASLKVPMTVFWGATKYEQFGYEIHHNIKPVKPARVIPNRLPHNIMNPEKMNIGVNKYSDKYINEILEIIKKK